MLVMKGCEVHLSLHDWGRDKGGGGGRAGGEGEGETGLGGGGGGGGWAGGRGGGAGEEGGVSSVLLQANMDQVANNTVWRHA